MIQPAVPKGTRDFPPEVLRKRQFILDKIRSTFELYGFQPLETPSIENLSTLEGKYGEEGDKLIFRILDNGDILEKAKQAKDSRELASLVSSKALRYDLTIPFARFVVMNQHQLVFPFRRYQMQPVWRADRPQKSRYREFYQCDADIIGTPSLLCEVELLQLMDSVLVSLGIGDFTLKVNHRGILAGLAALTGRPEMLPDITTAIDKMDKIGWEGVHQELLVKGMDEKALLILSSFLQMQGTNAEILTHLNTLFPKGSPGHDGVASLSSILGNFTAETGSRIQIGLSLARGLSYYTGTIIEAKPPDAVKTGSIGGGGRYDNLTGLFGLRGISGVGISFGVDRIYDVMEALGLFKADTGRSTRVLLLNLGEAYLEKSMTLLQQLRDRGLPSEIYPDQVKMEKQLRYADKNHIPFAIIIGESELQGGKVSVKNLSTGTQELMAEQAVLDFSFER
jgi:histidyl-tRNA synthetase